MFVILPVQFGIAVKRKKFERIDSVIYFDNGWNSGKVKIGFRLTAIVLPKIVLTVIMVLVIGRVMRLIRDAVLSGVKPQIKKRVKRPRERGT